MTHALDVAVNILLYITTWTFLIAAVIIIIVTVYTVLKLFLGDY
jgi:hypothetical protein